MCLAQGPQRSDAGKTRTRGLSVSSQALYHWATGLPYHMTEWFRQFVRILFSRNFAYAKFRENTTLMKIAEFTDHDEIKPHQILQGWKLRISKILNF